MSGARAPGTNVVPMPTNGPPTTPVPWPQPGVWPMPSAMAGCCPPSNLMQCYCDIQNATAFITAIMLDAINTNPAVAEAIIAAIQKSGSNLPLLGVTDGSNAQPGQVGEYVRFQQTVSILGTAQTQSVTMGVLQPGDWDVWLFAGPQGWTADIQIYLDPLPAGFIDSGYAILGDMGAVPIAAVGMTTRGSISVPTLMVMTLTTNNSGPGSGNSTCGCILTARRRR